MKRKVPRSKVNHERWLVSYADFITLLFAFFVVLYAFSKADQKKHAQVSEAIDHGFQSLSLAAALPMPHMAKGDRAASIHPRLLTLEWSSADEVRTDLEYIRGELQTRLSKQIAQGTISIHLGNDGLVISLREAGFFESGSAIPHSETSETLRQIADSLKHFPYDVRIEGHTDTVPIHNPDFDSNWELSSARATHIARMLLDLNMMQPERLSAAGYAEYHPVASNDTVEGRAANRRVDLVVMPRAVLDNSSDSSEDKSAWRKITSQ